VRISTMGGSSQRAKARERQSQPAVSSGGGNQRFYGNLQGRDVGRGGI
jgi:hypothetical protein